VRRRLFNLAAAVSLVLWAATATSWLFGHWRSARVIYYFLDPDNRSSGNIIFFGWGGTSVGMTSFIGREDNETGPRRASGWVSDVRSGRMIGSWIPSIVRGTTPSPTERSPRRIESYLTVEIPIWLLLVVTAILPARWTFVWGRTTRRRKRARLRLCPACDYDLRATPERCPECGAQAKPQPAEGAAA
jgi:hypothetical protein